MPKIEMFIECSACGGSGVYSGIGEGEGVAIICHQCKGTGKYFYIYHYTEFTGRKIKEDIERVYKTGSRFKLGLGKVDFKDVGIIDMDKEGVSYKEFLSGYLPEHIKELECPMMADQGVCHDKEGFVEECNRLHGGWISYIPKCKNAANKLECWKRFEETK